MKTHFSLINLLFYRFEAYIRSRNTGVAACDSFCSLNVKLSRNQSWVNLCFQTRETRSSTRFSIKGSRFSITGSRFSMKGSRFSILDSRRNRESRLAIDCQLTFERYCSFLLVPKFCWLFVNSFLSVQCCKLRCLLDCLR